MPQELEEEGALASTLLSVFRVIFAKPVRPVQTTISQRKVVFASHASVDNCKCILKSAHEDTAANLFQRLASNEFVH